MKPRSISAKVSVSTHGLPYRRALLPATTCFGTKELRALSKDNLRLIEASQNLDIVDVDNVTDPGCVTPKSDLEQSSSI